MTDQSPSRFRPHPLLIGIAATCVLAGVLVAVVAPAVAGLMLTVIGVR